MISKVLGLVIVSSLPFLFTLRGDFVFDDAEAIIKNKDVSSKSWVNIFYNDFWGTNIKSSSSHKSYRPLTTLTFRLNYILNNNKLSAVQFKITNLICHVVCCLVVWRTFESILKSVGIKYGSTTWASDTPYLAALLFAVHPIHVEAVCGIVGRADIMAAMTFFLAFLFYNNALNNSRYKYVYLAATVMMAGVSMLFKENGVTVLGFCLSYELVTTLNLKMNKTKYPNIDKDSLMRIVFLLTSAITLLTTRWVVMGGTIPEFQATDNPAAFSKNLFTKIATYNYIYFLNFLLLLWPCWLCFDWSMGCVPLIETILDYRIIFVIATYLFGLLVIIAVFNRRNKEPSKRLIILMVSLAAIPFLPASNIFYPVGFVIAERILYISSAGYCLFVTVGYGKIIRMNTGKRYKISIISFTLLIIVYALRSWQRSYEWQNEYRLFISGLFVCPLNAKVHYNVAQVADSRHQTAWALQEYKESIRLFPEYYQAMNNLGNLLKSRKQYTEAEFFLQTAVSLKRDYPAAWMNLGIVLSSVKRYSESLTAYKTALEYRKNYPDCLYNLGNLYLEINKTDDAMESWIRAINLNQTHSLAWTNLLALMDNTGQIEKALKLIPKVLTELPDSPSINFAVANIYGKLERYEEAEAHFLKAIQIFGSKVQAIHYANLGVLYHRWKKYDLAEVMYKNALKKTPLLESAQRNLNSLLKLKKIKNK